VTREAKAALERLPDRISIGVLAAVFTRDLIDEVIDEAEVREVRTRRLPARLMVFFVLASWLYMRSGYGLVMSKLTDALAVQGRGWGDWESPGTGSIAKARVRLGAAVLRLLFARVAGPAGRAATPGVFYAGRRVLCMDGFTLDLPDTPENDERFGRGSTAGGGAGPVSAAPRGGAGRDGDPVVGGRGLRWLP
jgi:Insertion element 4 transposase N-terminal